MIKNRFGSIALNVIGCLAFLSLPVWFAPNPSINEIIHNNRTQLELCTYLLIIGYFYFNYYYLLPQFYFKKKYVAFGLITLALFLVVHFLPIALIGDEMHKPPHNPGPPSECGGGPYEQGPDHHDEKHGIDFFFIGNHAFNFLLGFFLSLIIRINNKMRQVTQEKLNAELSYLKAQINPHFIFNTLNSIYAMALEGSKDMADAIVKLSGMMRYVLTDASQEYVALDKELEHIKSYVELQHYRFEDTITLSFDVTGDSKGKKIAPLLLMPFIENAFKHGINPEENSEISIRINITGNKLLLGVQNKKVSHAQEHEKCGIGIENTKNRLQLLYNGRHTLIVKDENRTYSVSLSLDLE